MDNKRLINKFASDAINIEKKLLNVFEGNSYRNLVNLYGDSIENIERYTYSTTRSYDFYIQRKDFVEKQLDRIEKASAFKFKDNDLKEYKMFNQAFQDLARIYDRLEQIIKKCEKEAEYDRLLKYSYEESFIDKDLLLDKVVSSNEISYTSKSLNSKTYLSINYCYVNNKYDTYCIITEIIENLNEVFIKNITIIYGKFNKIYNYIKNYYHNNNLSKIIVNSMGIGQGLVDLLEFDERLRDKVVSIHSNKITKNEAILKLKNDINNINFINYYDYDKKINEELLILFNEIQNVKLDIKDNGVVSLEKITTDYDTTRLNTLLNFYSYKNSQNKELTNNNEKEKRVFNYEIAHGILYKYMYKAIDDEKLSIIFYYNGCHKLRKIQNIIQEENFKKLFNKDIKNLKISRNDIEIYFNNGSIIKFVYASDAARGYRFHYAVVDTDIEREIYYNAIKPKSIPYLDDNNVDKLKDTYRIQFMDFNF